MTVQLEAGKLYQRGDGKVGVCRENPYRFWIDFGDGEIPSYTTDGKFDEGYDDPVLDILREVTPEPWRVTELGEHKFRDGDSLWVDTILPEPDEKGYQVIGHWFDYGDLVVEKWMIDGSYKKDRKSPEDIMPRECVEPTPAKSRPWSRPEDVPEGCVISHPSLNCPLPPASFNELVGVRFRRENGGSIVIPFQRLYDEGTYSVDGREWRKCEVAE